MSVIVDHHGDAHARRKAARAVDEAVRVIKYVSPQGKKR